MISITLVNLFLIYQPIFLYILLKLKRRVRNYKINTHVVSILGAQDFPYRLYFNLSLMIYGFLGLGVPLVVENMDINIHFIGIVALYLCCIGTILVGIFPMDIHKNLHLFATGVVFIGIFLTGIVFLPIVFNLLNLNFIFSIFNVIIVFLVGSLFFTFVSNRRYHSFFEWYAVLGAILWNFSFCLMVTNGIF